MRATKEFGLRSKGFVAYDLDPDRSPGNHSGGTDPFFFKASCVHGTMVMCTLLYVQEIALLIVKTNRLCRELRK